MTYVSKRTGKQKCTILVVHKRRRTPVSSVHFQSVFPTFSVDEGTNRAAFASSSFKRSHQHRIISPTLSHLRNDGGIIDGSSSSRFRRIGRPPEYPSHCALAPCEKYRCYDTNSTFGPLHSPLLFDPLDSQTRSLAIDCGLLRVSESSISGWR